MQIVEFMCVSTRARIVEIPRRFILRKFADKKKTAVKNWKKAAINFFLDENASIPRHNKFEQRQTIQAMWLMLM